MAGFVSTAPVCSSAGDIEPALVALDCPLPKQVRCYALRIDRVKFADCYLILSAEERQRYERITSPARRRHFLAGRYAVRMLLAKALGVAPDQLRLHEVHGGAVVCEQGWQFSLSHSGNWLLVALHPILQIGIDLQIDRQLRYPRQLLQKLNGLASITAVSNEAVLQLWVRMEAVLKATGMSLAEFRVLGRPGQNEYLWRGRKVRVLNLDFAPTSDYYAALSVFDT